MKSGCGRTIGRWAAVAALAGVSASWGAPSHLVDYRHDYFPANNGNQWYRGAIAPAQTTLANAGSVTTAGRIMDVDLDNDGRTDDDQIMFYPFSMATPLSPVAGHYDASVGFVGYDTSLPSAVFYGGITIWEGNFRPAYADQAYVTWRDGADPHTPDPRYCDGLARGTGASDIYSEITLFAYDGGAPFPVDATEGPDDISKYASVFLWKKQDFMAGGSTNRVLFDADSRLTVNSVRHWVGVGDAHWVAGDGDQLYISEATFSDGGHTWFGQHNVLSPTTTRWAKYNPSGYDLAFDASTATFAPHDFTDVTSYGVYVGQNQYLPYTQPERFVIDGIQLDATVVPVPAGLWSGLSLLGGMGAYLGVRRSVRTRTKGAAGGAD